MSHNNNRKRSRWGDRPGGDQDAGGGKSSAAAAAASGASAVSDQEALEALLASAKSKEEPQRMRQPRDNSYNKKPRRGDDDDDRKRHRDGRGHTDRGVQRGGRNDNRNNGPDYSYYGNNKDDLDGKAKSSDGDHEGDDSEEPKDKEKPNFGLSGALAQEEVGELKFREPPEARAPNTLWRFYVFKNDKAIETLHISKQSAYLFGRNKELADIPLLHPSASGQHAVLQYRALPGKEDGKLRCKPYLMDLESTNGSFINGVQLDPARYYELKKGDVLKFGASTREYVLLTENTTAIK